MASFKITPHAFEINGRETYLLMGEIHYFRMPPEGWRPALERLKECGCNAVAYYVPWFVHQPQEDTFDFEGQLHPQNNLRAWLRLTQEVGLIGFARLGPYVYAETTDLGIPRWFSSAHPEARVQDWRGGAYVEATRVGGVIVFKNVPALEEFLGVRLDRSVSARARRLAAAVRELFSA